MAIPTPVSPHSRADLKQFAVPTVWTGVDDRPLPTANAVRKRRVLVSSNKAWHQRNTSQNIADPADVKTGLVAAACRVIQHWE